MERIIIIVGAIIFASYLLYIFSISFLNPKKTMRLYKCTKERDKKIISILPNKLLNFMFFNNDQKATIWFTRIMAIVGLGIASFIIYALAFYTE